MTFDKDFLVLRKKIGLAKKKELNNSDLRLKSVMKLFSCKSGGIHVFFLLLKKKIKN